MREAPSGWNKLRQLGFFADDSKTQSFLDVGPLAAACGFSTRLGWSSRSAQMCQEFVHPATDLLWGGLALFAFPRTKLSFHQISCQHQMVMGHGDNVTPAFKLLWGAQAWSFPQKGLFVETITVLLRETTSISQANLHDIGFVALPSKQTNSREDRVLYW